MARDTRFGLCGDCAYQKLVGNTRGSRFSMCLRSREDRAYPKYPRMPVVRCAGFAPRSGRQGPA